MHEAGTRVKSSNANQTDLLLNSICQSVEINVEINVASSCTGSGAHILKQVNYHAFVRTRFYKSLKKLNTVETIIASFDIVSKWQAMPGISCVAAGSPRHVSGTLDYNFTDLTLETSIIVRVFWFYLEIVTSEHKSTLT